MAPISSWNWTLFKLIKLSKLIYYSLDLTKLWNVGFELNLLPLNMHNRSSYMYVCAYTSSLHTRSIILHAPQINSGWSICWAFRMIFIIHTSSPVALAPPLRLCWCHGCVSNFRKQEICIYFLRVFFMNVTSGPGTTDNNITFHWKNTSLCGSTKIFVCGTKIIEFDSVSA